METTITISYLADLIIVFGCASLIGCVLGNLAGRFVIFIGEKIRDRIRNRKKENTEESV
ncbi:MAG: hypothetical protein IJV41_02360 [Oscillospiraceae bacterium]|nr:hypothetical protein [Parasporobacterium sp.]MBQ9685377.1 hypothetical protein [Oscillospiraceae bacterium]